MIMRKFSTNAYELNLPPNMVISPIFNVKDLYLSKHDKVDSSIETIEDIKEQIEIGNKNFL